MIVIIPKPIRVRRIFEWAVLICSFRMYGVAEEVHSVWNVRDGGIWSMGFVGSSAATTEWVKERYATIDHGANAPQVLIIAGFPDQTEARQYLGGKGVEESYGDVVASIRAAQNRASFHMVRAA